MPHRSDQATVRLPAHIPALNGLRAFACLAVFGVHWQQFTRFTASWGAFDAKQFLEHGNTGVSLLFTLSAFLVSLRFWAGTWGHGRPWLGQYARSRAVRILPPYYLCLGALVAYSGHFLTTHGQLDTVLHLAFLHNFHEQSFYSLSPTFWTLAVQAQSYVVIPLVIILTLRVSSAWNRRAVFLAALVVASYGVHWATLTLAPGHAGIADWAASRRTVATHSLLAHAPHFVLGLLAGLVYVWRIASGETASARWAAALRELAVGAAIVLILLILSTPLDAWFSVPYGRYNFPVVPVLIAWLILEVPRTSVIRSALDIAPLHWLGVISFGVYVYHYPCLGAVAAVMGRAGLSVAEHWALFGAASLALTILVAGLSFVAIETPLAQLMRPRESRPRGAFLPAS